MIEKSEQNQESTRPVATFPGVFPHPYPLSSLSLSHTYTLSHHASLAHLDDHNKKKGGANQTKKEQWRRREGRDTTHLWL